ncbi:hypothetical protein B0F90DRAFT_688677 [Multifurca ochricompacta]|uniref:Uncharacterized protein n=1 Tax=Multifurca ochricompacta TaxID=376703 RepID=A0AAD4QMG6_9AGAM|nr:hypothetical protein B0F90DRAFT_688677 [Multifurca ochricompacta]
MVRSAVTPDCPDMLPCANAKCRTQPSDHDRGSIKSAHSELQESIIPIEPTNYRLPLPSIMSTADNTITEVTTPAAVSTSTAPAQTPEAHPHRHGGIIGKVEGVIHGISDKLHSKHDRPAHPESETEHRARAGTIGDYRSWARPTQRIIKVLGLAAPWAGQAQVQLVLGGQAVPFDAADKHEFLSTMLSYHAERAGIGDIVYYKVI